MLLPLLLALVVAIGALIALLTSAGDASHRVPAWQPLERGTAWVAVAFAAVAAASLLIVPVYEAVSVSGSAGTSITQRHRETLLSVNGLAALPPVLLPVLLAAIPCCEVRPTSGASAPR